MPSSQLCINKTKILCVCINVYKMKKFLSCHLKILNKINKCVVFFIYIKNESINVTTQDIFMCVKQK